MQFFATLNYVFLLDRDYPKTYLIVLRTYPNFYENLSTSLKIILLSANRRRDKINDSRWQVYYPAPQR